MLVRSHNAASRVAAILNLLALLSISAGFASLAVAAEPNDHTLGISLATVCRGDAEGCFEITHGTQNDCGQGLDRSDCALRAIEAGTFLFPVPELPFLSLLRRLSPLLRVAAAEVQLPETFLYGHLWLCAFRQQKSFIEDLSAASRLDGRGFIVEGPGEICPISNHWLQSTLLSEAIQPLGSMQSLKELLGSQQALSRSVRIWARVYRHLVHSLQNGSRPDLSQSPLLVYSVLESGSERRVFAHPQRGDAPFLPRAKAWLVAQHWSHFTNLMNSGTAPIDGYAALLSLENFPFPQHAAAELRLPNRRLELMTTKAIPLYGRPDQCHENERRYSEGRVQNETGQRLAELRNRSSFVRGTLPRGPYQVLDQSLHCGEEWSLVRNSGDALGWVKSQEILAASRPGININYCQNSTPLEECREQIAAAIGSDQILDFDESRGSIAVRLIGFPESEQVDYRSFHPSCIDETLRKQLRDQSELNVSHQRTFGPASTNSEAPPWLHSQGLRAVELLRDEETEPMTPALRDWIESKMRILRDQLRLSMGVDVYDPFGPLAPLFGWYHEVARLCRPDCIITMKQELEIFFNLAEPEKLRDIQHFAEMQELYFRGREKRRAAQLEGKIRIYGPLQIIDQQVERIFALSLAEQIAELDGFCLPFVSQKAELRQKYEELRRLLQVFNASALTQSYRLYGGGFAKLANSCLGSLEAWQRYRGENPATQPWPFLTLTTYEEPHSPFWGMLARQQMERESELRAYQIIGASLETLAPSLLQILNAAISEVERDLDRADQWLRLRGQQVAVPSGQIYQSCSYNPLASEARMRQILALPCVQGVLVPNEKYLLQRFLDPREAGAFTLSEHRDRVEILLRRDCR